MRLVSVILATGSIFLLGCINVYEPPVEEPELPEAPNYLLDDFISSLELMHNKAMQDIDEEIEDLDGQIAHKEWQEEALRGLISQINSAINYWDAQVSKEPVDRGTWEADILTYGDDVYSPEEYKAFYSNEYYETIKLRCKWLGNYDDDVWELTTTVLIEDKETRITGVPDVLLGDLLRSKSDLIDSQTTLVETRARASQVLSDVLKQQSAWEVVEVADKVFSISGYGLGYYESGLSIGEWYYYEEGKTIEPKSTASIELRDVLTAQT